MALSSNLMTFPTQAFQIIITSKKVKFFKQKENANAIIISTKAKNYQTRFKNPNTCCPQEINFKYTLDHKEISTNIKRTEIIENIL